MDANPIREYLLDFQKKELPELVEREIQLDASLKIKSIIGPRRAGKTYFLFQKIQSLISNGVKKENIVYLNFEDPRLVDLNFKEIREVIKLHWQIFPNSTKGGLYIFIDEPQAIKNWEISVRSLHDEGFYVFISGSSSKLLSKEIATSLRGRTISYLLLPFSFKEFLQIKDASLDIQKLSSKEESRLLSLLDDYLNFGGFPEISKETNIEIKLKILSEYFNSIVYKDIVERYRIQNIQLIKWLIKTAINSLAKEFSIHKIYLTLKSQKVEISKNTLYTYTSMLEDAFFIFLIPRFGYSIRKRDLTINKAYLSDLGFTRLIGLNQDIGLKMENVVFLELERRKEPLTEIFYWKNVQQEEVDFVVKKGNKIEQLIQVCYNISDIDVKKRELRALLKASKELKCKKLQVITYNKFGEEKINQLKIIYTPLWKWLLKE